MFLSNSSSGDNGNVGSIPSDLDESKTSEEDKEKDSGHDNFIKVLSDYKRQNAGLDESKTSEENKEKDSERDNFVKAFSDYKRQSAGIISEAKKKEVYLKPSVRRKLKTELARKKRNKRNKNNYRFGR